MYQIYGDPALSKGISHIYGANNVNSVYPGLDYAFTVRIGDPQVDIDVLEHA